MNIDKIISIIKTLREEAAMAAPTNNVGGGQIAGTREAGDDPPVKKKKKYIKKRKKRGELLDLWGGRWQGRSWSCGLPFWLKAQYAWSIPSGKGNPLFGPCRRERGEIR